ncbi:MAG: cupredoxin domain-containing protein [Candidatus Woesearchaeota archaeon]
MKIYLAVLLAAIVLLAGCGMPATEQPAVTPTEPMVTEEAKPMPTATVDITRKAFVPNELRVKLGTAVTWINKDTIGHTVSFRQRYTDHSTVVPAGKTLEVVFTDLGEFNYINGALGLKGKVIVEE